MYRLFKLFSITAVLFDIVDKAGHVLEAMRRNEVIGEKICIQSCYLITYYHFQGYFQKGKGQIPTYVVKLNDLLKMQRGLGWPSEMLVSEGQEALMKLKSNLPGQQSCMATPPGREAFDVASPPINRYERWGDGCGLRVRGIELSDTGRWRLTAASGSDSRTGWIEVTVQEDKSAYIAPPISLQDGETQTNVELTTLDNSYCLVAQPFSESSLVAGHCHVTLDKTTRAVQGNWHILIGLPGRISEIQLERRVAVEAERLDVGYIHDSTSNRIHLYCNILHTKRNVTFCRFQRTIENTGYNIMEGLSDGTHSYYGDGFVAKHCGVTIEQPTVHDYTTWRCSVGSQRWVDQQLQQQAPMQALINVMPNHESATALLSQQARSLTEDERTVFVQAQLSFTVMCRAELSLAYCWFLHPNGSQFSPISRASEEQDFWYTGESLQTGDCGITFSHAAAQDAGDWICHMGARDRPGLELTDRVLVRVTGPLAANKKKVNGVIGKNATLLCHTSNGNRPLDYCRFLTPNYVGINIDASVTRENAILDRYYFTPERNPDYGDCSLTISAVEPEDIGTWTCAALINNELLESTDTIELLTDDSQGPRAGLSQAGIAGMTLGLLALGILLAGVVWHKIGRPIPWKRNNTHSTHSSREISFDVLSTTTLSEARNSTTSDRSMESSCSSNAEEPTTRKPEANPSIDPREPQEGPSGGSNPFRF